MRYFSAHRSRSEWRYVSVQRVQVGPPSRFVAVCHRSGTLKWFRVENVSLAKLESAEAYRTCEREQVQAYVDGSVDGFHGEGDAFHSTFIVREPDAHWLRHNLLEGMYIDPNESVRDGIRVHVQSAGIVPVARFVVGLGAAARVETPELAACVRELARGALEGTSNGTARAKRLRSSRAAAG
jgi:hypothetical protein